MVRKDHPLHKTWLNIRTRCNNPNNPSYPNYGGRGITICERWDDFWLFVEDVGERPDGCSLDRINNDGNYEPSNVRWATRKEQNSNKRRYKRRDGTKGYRWAKGAYQAEIKVDGKNIYLGRYDCPLMAHLAYREAVEKL